MMRTTSLAAVALAACTFGDRGTVGGEGPKLAEPDMTDMPATAPDPESEPEPDRPTDEPGDPDADDPADPRPGGDLPPPQVPPDDDDGDGSGGDEDPPADACPMSTTELLWAEDATTIEPMLLATATGASGEPLVAVSEVADSGDVVFDVDLPCAGDYYLHGLLWDYSPGAWATLDPDSLYVGTGAPEMFVWRYGCQTGGMFEALSWQPLERLDGQPCATTPITLAAPAAGTYALTFRNREEGLGSIVAGIAAIVVTTDPDLDPYTLYAPY